MKTLWTIGLERPLFGQFVRQIAGVRSEELESCLAEQQQSGGRLGELLRRRNLLTREQFQEALRAQARWVAATMRTDMPGQAFPSRIFLSLCMPAFNEQETIGDTLDAACAILPEFVQLFEVVVIDDGSRDNTAELVARYAEKNACVRLIRHEGNKGYGAAVSTGLRAARGDVVGFTDSDGQFCLLDLPQLLTRLKGNGAVLGYRYQRADHWTRCLNAWAWNRLIRMVLGVRVKDLDCAFKLFRRPIVDRLCMDSTGAAINAEILVQCVWGGINMCEVPVNHYPRTAGSPTGAALKVILRAFRELPRLWKYRAAPPRLAQLQEEGTVPTLSWIRPSRQQAPVA